MIDYTVRNNEPAPLSLEELKRDHPLFQVTLDRVKHAARILRGDRVGNINPRTGFPRRGRPSGKIRADALTVFDSVGLLVFQEDASVPGLADRIARLSEAGLELFLRDCQWLRKTWRNWSVATNVQKALFQDLVTGYSRRGLMETSISISMGKTNWPSDEPRVMTKVRALAAQEPADAPLTSPTRPTGFSFNDRIDLHRFSSSIA